jgi:hypothetical protein
VDLRQIERLQRNQLVGNGIVEFAIDAFAVRLMMFFGQASPRQTTAVIPTKDFSLRGGTCFSRDSRLPHARLEAAQSE